MFKSPANTAVLDLSSVDHLDRNDPNIIEIESEVVEMEFLVSTREGCLNKILRKLGDMCFAAYDEELSYEIIPGHPLFLTKRIMPSQFQDEIVRKNLLEGFAYADPLTVIECLCDSWCKSGTTLSTFWKNKYFVLEKNRSIRADFCSSPTPRSVVILHKQE